MLRQLLQPQHGSTAMLAATVFQKLTPSLLGLAGGAKRGAGSDGNKRAAAVDFVHQVFRCGQAGHISSFLLRKKEVACRSAVADAELEVGFRGLGGLQMPPEALTLTVYT